MRIRTIVLVCALVLTGCKIDGIPSTTETADGAAAAKVTVCPNGTILKGSKTCPTTQPMPSPPLILASTTVPAASLAGEVPIADNFDVASWLEPGEAPHASPDEVGAFRFTCLAGHIARNDPIVYPGQPGKSHLHQFFGNTDTDANSTYQSLRTKGGSTCTRSGTESPQRSAYWMPAMLDGAGNVVKPDWINTYYKQLPASDPNCSLLTDPVTGKTAPGNGKCVVIPNGLRFILGFNMADGANDFTNGNTREYWAMGYDCMSKADGSSYAIKRTLPELIAIGCPAGAVLRVFAAFPQCWDGKNLDSADHRAHIAFPVQSYCPTTHPYKFPEVAVSINFTTDANFVAGKWRLDSDAMYPNRPAGSTLHMDYWEAWSPVMKTLWQANCIDGHLTCSTGNVGDGRQIKGMQQVGPVPEHVLVPLSAIGG